LPKLRALCATTALAISLLSVQLASQAQQPTRVPRIGYLTYSGGDSLKSQLAAFKQGLREIGYVEGKDIIIEHRAAEGESARLPAFAAELVRLEVDILVTGGTPAAHAAKNATSVIPIVIGHAGDPVGSGLVAGLARPGGNVTGLSDFASGVALKRLQLLTEAVPSASRVAVLSNPINSTNPLQLKELDAAAPALGVTLLPLHAK
jgi:putative ABC transport system substrate-binding protein